MSELIGGFPWNLVRNLMVPRWWYDIIYLYQMFCHYSRYIVWVCWSVRVTSIACLSDLREGSLFSLLFEGVFLRTEVGTVHCVDCKAHCGDMMCDFRLYKLNWLDLKTTNFFFFLKYFFGLFWLYLIVQLEELDRKQGKRRGVTRTHYRLSYAAPKTTNFEDPWLLASNTMRLTFVHLIKLDQQLLNKLP